MNDDPFDMTADQVSRALIMWAAGVMGWNLLSQGDIRDCHRCAAVFVGECAASRFKDRPLQLVRADAAVFVATPIITFVASPAFVQLQ
jgi:hypothetical protein